MSFWTFVGWLAWSASFVNIMAIGLQLRRLAATQATGGVSIGMLGIFAYVQLVFCLVGFHEGQWALFAGMLGSFIVTVTTVSYARYLRTEARRAVDTQPDHR